MRLILLTAFTMVAFAANSVLTRMAIEPGFIDPVSFSLVRVLAGAVFLYALARGGNAGFKWFGIRRAVGAISLSVYMVGFSLAYVTLDAGLGALILFGVVQISMFAYSAVTGTTPRARQLLGAGVAFSGLVLVLWPDEADKGSLQGALLMAGAGIGWAVYTLSGKGARNPLSETAANFAVCLPILILLTGAFARHASTPGILLAVLCGAATSGLGYALWYKVLPDLERSTAAVAQLSVPIIAIVAGSLLLNEQLTAKVITAAVLVVLGIGLAVTRRSSPGDHS